MKLSDSEDFWIGFLVGTIGTLAVVSVAMWVLGALFDL